MKNRPIYIKSLKLKNIRTFGKEQEISFLRPDGTLPNWTLILGDNGIGKTTILRLVAWMKPHLENDGDWSDGEFDAEPYINDEENATLERLVRKQDSNSIKANVRALYFIPENEVSNLNTCAAKVDIETIDGKLKEFFRNCSFDHAEAYSKIGDVLVYAYSANRSLEEKNMSNEEQRDILRQFHKDETKLYDLNEILHTVQYAALGSDDGEKKKYSDFLQNVKEALLSVLEDVESIDDIHISPPKLVNNKLEVTEVSFSTRHGRVVPYSDFSLGYRSVAALVVDLAWRMFNKYSDLGEEENPLDEPAIVLIDEIDLHLHPKWQREVMANLSNHFPNVQFIATAHSPLMVQAAIDSNFCVLKYHEDGVIIQNTPEGIDGWRIDQILTSEFFGLPSARGLRYEKLVDERQALVEKGDLRKEEELKLADLDKKLSELPEGESPEEIENRKLISDLVSKIKDDNDPIVL